jgi:hypothetical protein
MAIVLFAVVALPPGIRELVMASAAVASYFTTARPVHDANDFTLSPIKEIAWLFAGIFATMTPALDYMVLHAGELGLHSDMQFYWLSGSLSGVLDNAPTYLTFLAAAFGLEHLTLDNPEHMREFIALHGHYLIAISLGSTCFGALTYIGNGPNLMVKAIAELKRPYPQLFRLCGRYSLPDPRSHFLRRSVAVFQGVKVHAPKTAPDSRVRMRLAVKPICRTRAIEIDVSKSVPFLLHHFSFQHFRFSPWFFDILK